LLRTLVHLHVLLVTGPRLRSRWRAEAGQTSAEYALVVLGAAAVALLIGLWARNTDQIGRLLDTIFGSISRMARG
jgi:Flp pilus assembly pilin Flp